jgi:flagellar biogenesis protein FliO
MKRLRLSLVILSLATPALAQDTPDASAGRPDSPSPAAQIGDFPTPLAGSFARVLAALALISGGGAALAWWSRKRRGLIGSTTGRIQILASRAIGPRHQLVLVEVGERRLLLGTAPESVRALADLSEVPPFAAQLARELPGMADDAPALGSFGDLHV